MPLSRLKIADFEGALDDLNAAVGIQSDNAPALTLRGTVK